MKIYLIGILFILASCNGQKKLSVDKSINESQEEDTPLTLILQDEHSGFVHTETMIIKDQKRLKSLYSKINQTRKPGLPVPEVDFSKEMVVLQCSGEQVQIVVPELAFHKETDLEIFLTSKLTLEPNNSPNLITYPFCLYKMPLTDKEVVVIVPKKME